MSLGSLPKSLMSGVTDGETESERSHMISSDVQASDVRAET